MRHKKQASLAELKEYARTHSWLYQMDNAKGLDSHSNYSGGMEYPHFVVSCGRNRDSELLQESNFDSALEMLGGESGTVKIERFGHWGCGWFELILVDPKDRKALRTAYDIHVLLKDYPVLDDSDHSEREFEYQSNFAKEHCKELAANISKHFGAKNTRALVRVAYELEMDIQMYAGNDACIGIYSRDPDAHDVKQLAETLERVSRDPYTFKNSRVLKALVSAVNAYKVKEAA